MNPPVNVTPRKSQQRRARGSSAAPTTRLPVGARVVVVVPARLAVQRGVLAAVWGLGAGRCRGDEALGDGSEVLEEALWGRGRGER